MPFDYEKTHRNQEFERTEMYLQIKWKRVMVFFIFFNRDMGSFIPFKQLKFCIFDQLVLDFRFIDLIILSIFCFKKN